MLNKNAPDTSGKNRKVRFTIGFKLISIISLLIICSMVSMIVIVSYYFKDEISRTVEENNHKISQLVSLKVKSDLASVLKLSSVLTSGTDNKETARKIFDRDKSIVFIGIARRSGTGTPVLVQQYTNSEFCSLKGVSDSLIVSAVNQPDSPFMKSFGGEQTVENYSARFQLPIIGISLPLEKIDDTAASSILIVMISSESFQEAVQSFGIVKPYIVNSNGYIIAHNDDSLVLNSVNVSNLPIVKMMMRSPLNNGQTRYKDDKGVYHLGAFHKTDFADVGVIAAVDEERAFESIAKTRNRNIHILLIVLNLSIIIVFFFSKTITNPIKKLIDATSEIEKANFSYRISRMPGDEFGLLMNSFNDMIKGLSDREKIKDAFGKFVNKELAEQILHGEIKLGGERKTAAVFFSDIRSFTAISEKLEPEEVVSFLNEYMTRMVQCVNDTHGNVDKFIGDAVMAVWGTPVSWGNDTENAINGALAMRKSLAEFNEGRGGPKKPIIKIGCGINTGPLLAGQIGSHDRMEYTVIGDTVNLASRIEALNKPFGTDILISDDSLKYVKDIFRVEKMQAITVKGKTEPQQIWAVLGRKDDPQCPKSLKELRKLIGVDEKSLTAFDPDQDHEEKFTIVGPKIPGSKKAPAEKKPEIKKNNTGTGSTEKKDKSVTGEKKGRAN